MISRNFNELFSKVGFDAKKIANVVKDVDFCNKLWDVFETKNVPEPKPELFDLVYYLMSAKIPPFQVHQSFLLENIFAGKLENKQQLKIAEEYLKDKAVVDNLSEFETKCGVGIKITDEYINEYLTKFVEENKDFIIEKGGKFNHPDVLFKCKEGIPLADPSKIMKLLGPIVKNSIGEVKQEEKPKKKKEEKEEPEKFSKVDLTKLVARDVAGLQNPPDILAEHLKATGGKVITRFPPEPNGILHIGHARSIRFNFSIAGVNGGDCILRFDDTNPEKETLEFIENIKGNVNWFGYQPSIQTFTSNYFPKIYE